MINGPIAYSADGVPLVGKLPGVRNGYAMIGLRAGIGEGGGLGKVLAEIIAETYGSQVLSLSTSHCLPHVASIRRPIKTPWVTSRASGSDPGR